MHRYADKVASGYRPKRPGKMSDAVWDLVSACWHQDPVQRPHMSQVGEVARAAARAAGGQAGREQQQRCPRQRRQPPA